MPLNALADLSGQQFNTNVADCAPGSRRERVALSHQETALLPYQLLHLLLLFGQLDSWISDLYICNRGVDQRLRYLWLNDYMLIHVLRIHSTSLITVNGVRLLLLFIVYLNFYCLIVRHLHLFLSLIVFVILVVAYRDRQCAMDDLVPIFFPIAASQLGCSFVFFSFVKTCLLLTPCENSA